MEGILLMFELSVKTHFSGAHRLNGYDGPCCRVHGHNWSVEVFLRGTELDSNGMLVDFTVVKKFLSEVLEELDHRDLNEVPEFRSKNPTSEHISRYLFEKLSACLNCKRYSVSKIRVCETDNTGAAYWI